MKTSGSALVPIQFPIKWMLGAPPLGTRKGPLIADLKNEWVYTCLPLLCICLARTETTI